MDIAEFLAERKKKYKFKTTTEHFDELGGEASLKMTLRNFRQIEAGKQRPTPTLFGLLFSKSPDSQKKILIRAYFKSMMPEESSKAVDDFITVSMMDYPEDQKNIWNMKIPLAYYSFEQLDYLSKNRDALLFHKQILLYRKIHESRASIPLKKIERLLELELISYNKPYYKGHRQIYMVPKFESSNTRDFIKAVEYILENQKIFLDQKGNEQQRLTYTMQLVEESFVPTLMNQTKKFQDWLKSFAQHIPDSEKEEAEGKLVPIINISFSRALSGGDLNELGNSK